MSLRLPPHLLETICNVMIIDVEQISPYVEVRFEKKFAIDEPIDSRKNFNWTTGARFVVFSPGI